MGGTQAANTNNTDNRAATGLGHRTENTKKTKMQKYNKMKKCSRKCTSFCGVGMRNPGECLVFTLTYNKCAPQNYKRGAGQARIRTEKMEGAPPHPGSKPHPLSSNAGESLSWGPGKFFTFTVSGAT